MGHSAGGGIAFYLAVHLEKAGIPVCLATVDSHINYYIPSSIEDAKASRLQRIAVVADVSPTADAFKLVGELVSANYSGVSAFGAVQRAISGEGCAVTASNEHIPTSRKFTGPALIVQAGTNNPEMLSSWRVLAPEMSFVHLTALGHFEIVNDRRVFELISKLTRETKKDRIIATKK